MWPPDKDNHRHRQKEALALSGKLREQLPATETLAYKAEFSKLQYALSTKLASLPSH